MAKAKRVDDDFRVAVGFFAHPKSKKLARRLGLEGVIALMKLWAWATTQRCDGNLAGLSDDDIEDAVDWPGPAGALVPVLVDLRWIDGPAGLRVLHEWAEHNPYAASRAVRVEKAKRAAAARWNAQGDLPLDEPDDDEGGAGEGPPMPAASDSDAPSMPQASNGDARADGEQCPPHHTTPHHTPESGARARAGAHAREEPSPGAGAVPSAVVAGLAAAGIQVSDSNPLLLAAAQAGLPLIELVPLAREKAGKPLAYLLGTLRGRISDALAAGSTTPTSAVQAVPSSAGQGVSPKKPPEDPVANARAWAAQQVNFKSMSLAEAEDYVAGVVAREAKKNQQGVTA